jgi:hypothetical protein
MTQDDLADLLREMTERYFAGATVTWGRAKTVKPIGSLVLLGFKSLSRNTFPDMELIGETMKSTYQASTVFEVNLFTRGKALSAEENMSTPRKNTAMGDMAAYISYVNSPLNTEWLAGRDVCVMPKGDIQDLTALTNGTNWEYRAMAEFDVMYAQSALNGWATTPEGGTWEMTASGGGGS